MDAELSYAIEQFDLVPWLIAVGFEPVGRDEWVATCPRCWKDRKLTINVQSRRWHCWVCQREELHPEPIGPPKLVTVEGGGGLPALIGWLYGVTTGQAARWLIRKAPQPTGPMVLPEGPRAARNSWRDLDGLVPPDPPEGARNVSQQDLEYLRTRGIGPDLVQAYGIFGCGPGRYAGRVVFPAWGPTGRLDYWQARATWPAGLDEAQGRRHVKALNPPRVEGRFTSEHCLFNLYRAVQIGRGRVVLCEGPVSAIHAGDDAVACWGKQVSASQLRLLVLSGVTAVDLMLDGPTEREPQGAWPEMFRLEPWLRQYFREVRLVRVPYGDPGDHSREACRAFRSAAVSSAGVIKVSQL